MLTYQLGAFAGSRADTAVSSDGRSMTISVSTSTRTKRRAFTKAAALLGVPKQTLSWRAHSAGRERLFDGLRPAGGLERKTKMRPSW
jgi:hypothetical protein